MKLTGLTILVLVLGLLFYQVVKPDKKEFISDILGKNNSFEIVYFDARGEGLMGDLNRSWVIQFEKKMSLKNHPLASWEKARPEYSIVEMREELQSIYTFYELDNNKASALYQKIIPKEIIDLTGLAIVRIMELDGNKFFVKLESN